MTHVKINPQSKCDRAASTESVEMDLDLYNVRIPEAVGRTCSVCQMRLIVTVLIKESLYPLTMPKKWLEVKLYKK